MPVITFKSLSPGIPKQVEVRGDTRVGGEGVIFFSKDGQYAIKIYHKPQSDKEQLLQSIMSLFRSLPTEQTNFILPPLALVDNLDGERRIGFLMKRVPPNYRELGDFILSPTYAVRYFKQGRSWGDLLKVARSLANSLVVLHGKGCAHSDIHFRNFMADLDSGDCIMLEIDGVVVSGFLPPQVKGMMGFMAPEILTNLTISPNERTDRHSLAVLILHTLLLRNVLTPLIDYDEDPNRSEELGWGQYALFSEEKTDRRHRPANIGLPLYRRGALSYRILTPGLQKLTERAMIEGLFSPEKRPSSREWQEALAATVDELWMCTRCGQYFPYPYWLTPVARRRCPFCGNRLEAPYPAVLTLHEERGKNNFYSLGRYIVLGHSFKLFSDVVEVRRAPPFTRQYEQSVGYVEWDRRRNEYRLFNETGERWMALSLDGTNRVQACKGESVPLIKGFYVHFGQGKRLALVLQGVDGQ